MLSRGRPATPVGSQSGGAGGKSSAWRAGRAVPLLPEQNVDPGPFQPAAGHSGRLGGRLRLQSGLIQLSGGAAPLLGARSASLRASGRHERLGERSVVLLPGLDSLPMAPLVQQQSLGSSQGRAATKAATPNRSAFQARRAQRHSAGRLTSRPSSAAEHTPGCLTPLSEHQQLGLAPPPACRCCARGPTSTQQPPLLPAPPWTLVGEAGRRPRLGWWPGVAFK